MADTRYQIVQKSTANTPPTATSAATALIPNPARSAWMIQNLAQTNALFVNFGGSASASSFHIVLKGGTAADDGTGGSYSEGGEGVVYTGTVTVAGTGVRYTILEIS